MFLSYIFQSNLMNFMIYRKITRMCLNVPREKKTYFSDYQRHMLQREGFSKPPLKLVSNLRNKTNYIIHYRNLKLYLELGLRLTNVHCALSFNQLPWLKSYTNFHTRQLRKMILKMISLSWWTTRSLVSLLYDYLFFYVLIHWFIHCR